MFDVGEESKTANAAKISINFLLVSMLEALSESFLMMEKYGLEQKQFLDIANALFSSPVYQNYGTIMAELAKSHFENGIEKGLGDLDWAALITCIEK